MAGALRGCSLALPASNTLPLWTMANIDTFDLWLPSAAYLGSESEHVNQAITYPGHKTLCSLILYSQKKGI